MRRSVLCFSLFLVTLLPASSPAQLRERVKITGVRLGLPSGAFVQSGMRSGAFKGGQWAPVYVDLECVRDTEEPLLLVVETRDADDAFTEGTVEIAAMKKGERLNGNELGRIPYLKPGSYSASVSVRVKGAETGRTYGETSDRTFGGLDVPTFVLLGVGTNLSGLRFPLAGQDGGDERGLRNGWIQSGQILDVGLLPDNWIGYGAVDLMILGTGADRAFWEALAAPQHEKRRKAIVEWVRRGGRLVISVGTNPDVLEAVKEIRDMLPASIPPGGKKNVSMATYEWRVTGTPSERTGQLAYIDAKTEFPVVTIEPKADRPTRTLVTGAADKPLAIQGSYGLGRVTVFAFDLDRGPFTDWNLRAAFWENLVNFTGYPLPPSGIKFERYSSNRFDEFSASLQGSLDYFEGVPVVSFGWVALFILIYIILIGPVDYLFLKKVVRRLEWTWVTFPIIVISVSAAAYFAAYALKGKDLKTNKVDIVDIDLAGKRIDGNTYFTLFSPRIENYTIAVEPAGPQDDGSVGAWTPARAPNVAADSIVSWHGTVERFRSGGGGIFSKRYQYQHGIDPTDPNRDLYATAVEGVPIQVWTTKAFHAQWTAPLDPGKLPISAELAVSPANPNILVGSITNNLPIGEFTDMTLLWRGKAFLLKDFPVGVAKTFSDSAEQGAGPSGTVEDIKTWATRGYTPPSGSNFSQQGTTSNPKFPLWPVLFADIATENRRETTPNASLRRLDQSWRVAADRPEQAILALRVATRENQSAEEMSRSPGSPSRLWLGELPTAGGKRPALSGTLKQETYIRVFIPVKQAKK